MLPQQWGDAAQLGFVVEEGALGDRAHGHRRRLAVTGPPRAYGAVSLGAASEGVEPAVATGQDAVRLPLDDGWTATAWGAELHAVVRALADLGGSDEEVA